MSSSFRGKDTERAISRGGAEYRKNHRAAIDPVPTPTIIKNGVLTYTQRGPFDFFGTLAPSGKSIALEVKETAKHLFPVSQESWPDHQRNALKLRWELGALSLLVVAFPSETFSVEWPALQNYLEKPWRASLPIEWFRAYGLLLPDERGEEKRRCWFLDGMPHAEREQAKEFVEKERAASSPWVFVEDRISDDDPYGPPRIENKRTKEEIQESVRKSIQIGLERQLKKRRVTR